MYGDIIKYPFSIVQVKYLAESLLFQYFFTDGSLKYANEILWCIVVAALLLPLVKSLNRETEERMKLKMTTVKKNKSLIPSN